MVGDPSLANPTIRRWFNTAAFSNVVPGGGYSYGNVGRDSWVGPGLQNVDLGLFKNFHLTERLGLQFRAEAFNALNHANLSNPNSDSNSLSFGQISSLQLRIGTFSSERKSCFEYGATLKILMNSNVSDHVG